MSADGITRRSLLAAAAGAVAVELARPTATLAALAGPPVPVLREQRLGALSPGTRFIELPAQADLLGVGWLAPPQASPQLRFRDRQGRPSAWVSCAPRGHGPDRASGEGGRAGDGGRAGGGVIGEPVWTGGSRQIELRTTRPLGGVRLFLVEVGRAAGAGQALAAGGLAAAAAAPAPAPAPLDAGPGQPPIIPRRSWAGGIARPRVAPGYGAVRMAFVHHTENPNGYSPADVPRMLLAIFFFHREVRGWNDIGYNFVIDLYGRIFEARAGGISEPVVGAHAGGYNVVSTGVAVLGSFMTRRISSPARAALERLLAWKLSLHGVPAVGRSRVRVDPAGASFSRFPAGALVSLPRIAGHRDGDSTDCPGNALYGELPGIRRRARRLAGRPARATLALLAPPAAGAQPGEPAAGGSTTGPSQPGAPPPFAPALGLAGGLALLDGTPVPGAAIQIQQRSVARRGERVAEQTIAAAVTDADGQWSLPERLAPSSGRGIALRALFLGAGGVGATVSEPLHVAAEAPLSPGESPAPSAPAAPPPAT
jgi:N-acetylmuramoyl-L-alanine amidase